LGAKIRIIFVTAKKRIEKFELFSHKTEKKKQKKKTENLQKYIK